MQKQKVKVQLIYIETRQMGTRTNVGCQVLGVMVQGLVFLGFLGEVVVGDVVLGQLQNFPSH